METAEDMKAKFVKEKRALPAHNALLMLLFLSGYLLSGCQANSEQKAAHKPDSLYMKAGDKIVSLTFDSLRNSLLRQIASGGFEGAISFCRENATALTNTYADSASIRRTALRYRNPANKPDSLELMILTEMSSDMEIAKVPVSEIVRDDERGEIHYFKPIMTQAMCLNCHGKPLTQIQPEVQSKISERYPDDQAVNFKEGDLRGAWHILFKVK